MPFFDVAVKRGKSTLTSVGNVCGPHDTSYLFHTLEIGAEPAVHGEYLFIDDGGDREAIEAICKRLPQLDVVPSFT